MACLLTAAPAMSQVSWWLVITDLLPLIYYCCNY